MTELRMAERPFGRRASDRGPASSQTRLALRIVLVVVAVACALWLIVQLGTIILLLVLSIFFAYLVAPLVDFVRRRPFHLRGRERTLSRGLAIGVVYLLVAGLLVIVVAWLVPHLSQQVSQMASQAPTYLTAVQERGRSMTDALNRLGLPAGARSQVEQAFGGIGKSIEETGRSFLVSLVGLLGYLPWLVLIPILAFFLLKDAESFRETAIHLLPPGRLRANGAQLFNRVNAALAAYIRAQLLACVIVGTIVTVGFALLRVPYALLLGALAGLAEFIPLVGPVIVALSSAVLAALHEPILALWVLAFLGVLRVAEDYVIYPRLVGTVIHMHPLAIILAVLAGAELAGVAGIFLSVPVLAVLFAAYQQYLDYSATLPAAGGDVVTPPRPSLRDAG